MQLPYYKVFKYKGNKLHYVTYFHSFLEAEYYIKTKRIKHVIIKE
jgi:hypothetical protein